MSRRLLIVVQEALFFTTHRLPVGLAMQQRGWEVHVAAPADAAIAARLTALGFHVHPIPLARGGRDPVAELRLLLAMLRLIRRLQPALLHLVSIKPVIWGGVAARLLGVPAVVHAITGLGFLFIRQDGRTGLLRRIIERLYAFALNHRNSVAIFQNGDDRTLFEQRGMVQPGRWVMIRGCGVDMNVFAAAPEPEINENNPPIVMFPARLLGDKGIHEFVGAAERLRAAGYRARFVLVGRRDSDNPTDIGEALLQQWVEAGVVEYWGYAEDMPAMLARAHVIVMPSYREGLPRGLIEAAATGRAIVTADVPGCREVVRHGENGLLVPVRDAEATAQAIAQLLDDPELRRRLALRGRAMAEAEFSVERFVTESLAAYERVAGPLRSNP
ncbi:MAG TPA: glycosyltransferase family 4 protein [Ferrovibrio sp.]|uniref:glycosyltransferase family 4 protein n=1 Tax=Ferrovibrio sp. TaxID=1917215 RepID=UPI002B4B34D2|nr:glycosyltransferase family 4 protein [Ferrovibrio sp.]HLT77149.1 glycosyltransferase family 4 protein [Ferrovibrio sp.]